MPKRVYLSAQEQPRKAARGCSSSPLDMLPHELVCFILDRVPLPSWINFGSTCTRMRHIVHAQAKHYFRLFCGSQKILGAPSFLPQLLAASHECQGKDQILDFQRNLALYPPAGIYGLHTHLLPIMTGEPDWGEFNEPAPASVWKQAMSRGLSDVIILQLVPRLQECYCCTCCSSDHEPDRHVIANDPVMDFFSDDSSDDSDFDDSDFDDSDFDDDLGVEDDGMHPNHDFSDPNNVEDVYNYNEPFCLLSILNIDVNSAKLCARLCHVAEAVIKVLSSGKCHTFTTKMLDIGHEVISFVSKQRQPDVVCTAFRYLLTTFDFCELLRKIILYKPRVVSHSNDKLCDPQAKARAVSFVFDAFRQHGKMPLNFFLTHLTLLTHCSQIASRIPCCSKLDKLAVVAACPDLMGLPYAGSVLRLCCTGGPSTDDPTVLLQSPWFVMPDGLDAIQETLKIVVNSDCLKAMTLFCSLLKPDILRRLTLGKCLYRRALSHKKDMMTWLFNWMAIVTQHLRFGEWMDRKRTCRLVLLNSYANTAELRKFSTLYPQ